MSFSASLAPFYDILNDGADYDGELQLLAPYLPQAGARGLDLGCGTGEWTLRLAPLYRMTAMDDSVEMLSCAERKTRERNLNVCYLQGDICKLSLPYKADFALCLHDTVNYILQKEALSAFFERVYDSLSNGGLFALDLSTLYRYEKQYAHSVEVLEREGLYCVFERDYCARTALCNFRFDLFSCRADGAYERGGDVQRQRYYDPREVAALLKRAGFVPLENAPRYPTRSRKLLLYRKEN